MKAVVLLLTLGCAHAAQPPALAAPLETQRDPARRALYDLLAECVPQVEALAKRRLLRDRRLALANLFVSQVLFQVLHVLPPQWIGSHTLGRAGAGECTSPTPPPSCPLSDANRAALPIGGRLSRDVLRRPLPNLDAELRVLDDLIEHAPHSREWSEATHEAFHGVLADLRSQCEAIAQTSERAPSASEASRTSDGPEDTLGSPTLHPRALRRSWRASPNGRADLVFDGQIAHGRSVRRAQEEPQSPRRTPAARGGER